MLPALVIGEVLHFVGLRCGAEAEATFLRGLSKWDVQAPAADEWSRIGELVERYADFALGGVDASVVALAERVETPHVMTFDRRHFRAVKPRHCDHFELLP